MKTSLLVASAALFLFAAGPMSASPAPTHAASQAHPTDVTGCLEQGPVAKEYLIRAADGTEWGVNEDDRDLRLNKYIGRTVTVVGDQEHASKEERKEGGASHYLYARDLMVAGDACQK